MTPTELTLKQLRKEGYLVAVVEKWNSHVGIRQDLFGFGDILAVHPMGKVFMLVQATTNSNVAARLTKSKAVPNLGLWLMAGGVFEVWGWVKRGARWECKRVPVMAEELTPELAGEKPRRRKAIQGSLFV